MEYEKQVYEKQVKALRICSSEINCGECPFSNNDSCSSDDMLQDAANSIEELLAQVKDKDYLIQQQADEIERLRQDVKKQQEKMIELAKKLPKRGEWITIRLNNGGSYTGCSCCEAPIPTDTMLDYIHESESKYCYSCGAKMEVQDAD